MRTQDDAPSSVLATGARKSIREISDVECFSVRSLPQYMILSVMLCSTFWKYILLLLDARWEARGVHWPSKNTWLFYLEFTADLVRLCLYLVFFLIICTYYGLPLHLIRELGITFYQLRERVLKFLHFRRLTKNMQERFPDATAAQLAEGDRTCIVCREDMEVGQTKR
jgi:E3 ubiquitin-protein ligase synoviolin